ncbi:uncharacterized protein LOC127704113 [Mytilus californianus]|uniref:uncharacterized protein LOC127704113 n=1 Tax=Mytilus californianus TaxID=6549 RepID=UPI00224807B5|nr:uncharacterized protein LOC127704113 [Mytilus californianus]
MLIFKYCVLVFILPQINVTSESGGVCYKKKKVNGKDVITERCCNGFVKRLDGKCKECPSGSYGENCRFNCIAPFYGKQCENLCECKRCHHIYGCGEHLSTTTENLYDTTEDIQSSKLFNPEPTDISTEHATRHYKPDISLTQRPEGNQNNDNQGQLTIWVYVAVVGVLLLIVGGALFIKIGLAKTICKFLSNSKQTEHEDNLRIIRIQPILEEINDAASEEDVYCEIRESRMIDCINQARPLTGRFNSNVKPFPKKCSTLRENIYNHLNYNQSLPNLCIGNDYEHAHANNTIGLLTNSENCLIELRENRKLQSVPELMSSDSYEEVSCSTNYGIIWGNQ